MSSRSHLLKAVVPIAAVALIASGCSSSSKSSSSSNTSNNGGGSPKSGGTLTYIIQNELASLDPASNTSAAGAGSFPYYVLYDALFTLDSNSGKAVPKIGQSLTPDASNKVWTLKLRSGVKFSDGTPYDAAAVAYNWQRLKDPALKSPLAAAAAEIASTKVTDPTTLQVTLTAPDSAFDRNVAQQLLFVASPTALKSEGAGFATKPVGAGSFKLTSWVRDSQKTFDRNTTYYDAPRPYLDKLVIKTIPDENQAVTAVQSGQADVLYTQDASVFTRLKGSMQEITTTTPGSPNLAFNMKKAPFDDPSIRKAVVQAVDTAQMAQVAGTVQPTKAPFPEGSPYNFGLAWPSFDKAAAQSAFDAYAASHGGPVTFTIGAFQDSANQKEAQFFQTALGQYKNVNVKISVESANTAIGNVFSGSFQAHLWGAPWYSPPGLYIYLHSGQQLNVYGYRNPEVDKALDAARATANESTQNDNYKTIVQHMVTDLPFFNYGVRQAGVVTTSKVHGVSLFYDAYQFIEKTWMS